MGREYHKIPGESPGEAEDAPQIHAEGQASRTLAEEVFDDRSDAPGVDASVEPETKAAIPDASKAPPRVSSDSLDRWPTPSQRSASDPRLGVTLLERYRLEKLVGKGGMGRVYRATQFPLNRPVAVKVLSPEFQEKDPQFVRRFFLEAASAARLTHPNTITVFDYGEAETGELFIVMEYLRGRPLSRVISTEGPFPSERTLHVGMQICRALREAHAKGIIHRDLKPGNILLLEEGDDGDFVKVLDFGLVKLFNPDEGMNLDLVSEAGSDGELTKAGMFLGSPKYMSPEQIQGLTLDQRTDIYALGVLLYQMSTGRAPFTGASSVDIIYKHIHAPVPSFSSLGVQAPVGLESLIGRCLAKRRDQRFHSMNDLLVQMKDLHRVLTGISAAETGFSIDLVGLQDGVRKSPRAPGDPRTATVSEEAALAEPGLHEDTRASPSNSRAAQRPGRRARLGARRGAWLWLASGALVASLATLTYSNMIPNLLVGSTEGRSKPARVVVELVSEPAGAEVFHDGVSLGATPTRAVFMADSDPRRVEWFTFRAAGYRDAVVQARVGRRDGQVRARLEQVEAAPEAVEETPPAEDADSSYKDNPY